MLCTTKPVNSGFIFTRLKSSFVCPGKTGLFYGINKMLSKHFKKIEFACKDKCGLGLNDGDVNPELIEALEDVREHFGKPVIINSGLRCKKYNAKVNGAPKSQHQYGTAADIRVQGVSPADVHKYLVNRYPGKYGIGKYNTFTHIDVREGMARW